MVIGAVLGLVGAGGAMLAIPTFVYFFDFNQHQASRAALLVAISASMSALIPKFRSKEVLVKEALLIWSIGLVSNVGGTLISSSISEKFIAVGYSFILLLSAILLLIELPKPLSTVPPTWLMFTLAVSLGLLTGIFGVGGGFLAVPILVIFFNVSQNRAAGTSLLIILLNSITSITSHIWSWSNFNLLIPVTLSISATLVAGITSKLSYRISPTILRKSFSLLLLSISAFNAYQAFIISRF